MRFSNDRPDPMLGPEQFRLELSASGTVLAVTGRVDGSWPT